MDISKSVEKVGDGAAPCFVCLEEDHILLFLVASEKMIVKYLHSYNQMILISYSDTTLDDAREDLHV